MADPEKPATVEATVKHLSCPVCSVEYTNPIHPRTLIPDPSVLVCTSGGCRQYGLKFKAPTIVLWPAEKS